MVWEGVELKLPEEVASSVSLDTRKRSTDFPNVRITNFASGERMLPGEDNGLMSEEELHEGMMDHVNWLMEQFSSSVIHLDITYAAPRYRLTKPLCYMLGLNSEFLFSGRTQDIDVSAGVDPPDPFLASVTSSLFTQEASFTDANKACGSADLSASTPDISRLVQEVDQFGGLELSDDGDDSDSSGMDSDPEEGVGEKRSASQRSRGKRPSGSSPSGDRAVAAHLDLVERVRQKCPNLQSFSNFEETIVHDYYSSRGSQVLDISAIESQLLGEGPDGAKPNDSPASAALDELVLTHIEKGDMHGFTQLVSTLRPRKTMLSPALVHDMLIWKSWLINGQHLCFYGAGSKRHLMRSFWAVALRDGPCVTVDAYRLKGSICDGLWYILKRDMLFRRDNMSAAECKKASLKYISALRKPFYLIVLGLDTMAATGSLASLRPLLKIPHLRLIGTMDHLRSSLVVSVLDSALGTCKLVRVNTGMDYRNELVSIWDRAPPRYLSRDDNQKSAAEMQAIIGALSVNHRQLFSLIAQMQLDATSGGGRFDGIEKYTLLRERRAITICNSESKLDALLTEFITHNVIEQSRGPGGKLYLKIPFPPGELQQFTNL